jgi:MFS family permease
MVSVQDNIENRTGGGGRIFHGWKIVATALLTQALQAGLLIYSFGTIAVAIEEEFGVSRAQVMIAATVLSLSSNLISPYLGKLVDHKSVRNLMIMAVAALAAGLIALSFTQSIWQVWVVFATLLPAGNVLLGQLPTSALLTRWFSRLRGRAMGIAAVGTSLGGFVFPVLLTFLIELYDWRTALMIIGIGAFAVTAPVIRMLIVNQPGDIGLNPDGDRDAAPAEPAPAKADDGIGFVLRQRAFWCETVAIGISLFVYLGFLSNLYPHAIAVGTTPASAASLMSLVAVFSVLGKLTFGTVADKMDLRHTMWISFALMTAGTLTLSQVSNYTGLAAGAILFGLAAGGLLPVWGAMVAKSFGRIWFGRALGAMNLAMAPITLLSAPYAGFIYDMKQSYELAFLSYCGFLAIAAVSLLFLKFPGEAGTAGEQS